MSPQTNQPPAPGQAPVFRITVRALASATSPEVRLRTLLKRLLRQLKFACVVVEQLPAATPPGRDVR